MEILRAEHYKVDSYQKGGAGRAAELPLSGRRGVKSRKAYGNILEVIVSGSQQARNSVDSHQPV